MSTTSSILLSFPFTHLLHSPLKQNYLLVGRKRFQFILSHPLEKLLSLLSEFPHLSCGQIIVYIS